MRENGDRDFLIFFISEIFQTSLHMAVGVLISLFGYLLDQESANDWHGPRYKKKLKAYFVRCNDNQLAQLYLLVDAAGSADALSLRRHIKYIIHCSCAMYLPDHGAHEIKSPALRSTSYPRDKGRRYPIAYLMYEYAQPSPIRRAPPNERQGR
ncbi:uncharacterized protein BDW47DRAFT_62615 [Aspergillus candidus]|uniref:Uncharacterized protein n=1 Tax=Aspergillus candidus TaxID=41067 RepID=A0A2I2F4I3_ASPCN|nr:hypothetical protein BDW47DRAFT_62615 [Aspergillus candidus]PLB35486.1 hypothetical protein BDW47DRAFT_62615 [Aspergillus candidus]